MERLREGDTIVEHSAVAARVAQLAGEEVAVRPAAEAHHRVEAALDRLDALATHLQDQLGFVLDPNARVQGASVIAERVEASALAGTLHRWADSIEAATERLQSIAERVDLP